MTEDSNKEHSVNIALFEYQTIRRIWYKDTWYYSVVDVVAALTESKNPRRYWSDLKRRVASEGYAQVYANCVQLKMPRQDGKEYMTDGADTTTLLRIIQSIPSPKAEPFKDWLAQVGNERLQEMEDPELAVERW